LDEALCGDLNRHHANGCGEGKQPFAFAVDTVHLNPNVQ
jgi:hypothetical protein